MANKKSICTRGHDMDETRKFHPNGDSYCAVCKTIRTKIARKNNPEKTKQYYKTANRRRNYNLEPEEYELLLEKSKNLCMICSSPPSKKSLHIDHDHKTGKVRGLLCHGCNTALGLLKEDLSIMKKLIEYIERHS